MVFGGNYWVEKKKRGLSRSELEYKQDCRVGEVTVLCFSNLG